MSSNNENYLRRADMSKRRRIKPLDDAKTHVLSGTDKSGFMARLVDNYKGKRQNVLLTLKQNHLF